LGAWLAALASNRRKRVLAAEAAPLLAGAKDLFSRGELDEQQYVSLRDRCEAITLQAHPVLARWRLGRTGVWIGVLLGPLSVLLLTWCVMIATYETRMCAEDGCSALHVTGTSAMLIVVGSCAALAGLCAIIGIPAGWRGQRKAWGELRTEMEALRTAEHQLLVQANSKNRSTRVSNRGNLPSPREDTRRQSG
jgi:hypothetical protein